MRKSREQRLEVVKTKNQFNGTHHVCILCCQIAHTRGSAPSLTFNLALMTIFEIKIVVGLALCHLLFKTSCLRKSLSNRK